MKANRKWGKLVILAVGKGARWYTELVCYM